MPSRFKIKDIAVVALSQNWSHFPIGEAPKKGQAYQRMTPDEREQMLGRLSRGIDGLMNEAYVTHLDNCMTPHSNTVDPDYITRLSTNEFFFFTQEPLTLQEFEKLQQGIATKAETFPSGIQFIFGSFAVKTPDNQVVNIVPHISCGQPASCRFLIKNITSPLDVRYKEIDSKGRFNFLSVLDQSSAPVHMPQINISGVTHLFTFNNIISCKSPRGETFLTALDICFDHTKGVAKSNIDHLIAEDPTIINQPISHVVISNSVILEPEHCLGSVMHVDCQNSQEQCMEFTEQAEKRKRGEHFFGKDEVAVFNLPPKPCQTLEELRDLPEKVSIAAQALAKLKFGPQARPANDFIKKKLRELMGAKTSRQQQTIVKELNDCFLVLETHAELECLRPLHAEVKLMVTKQIEIMLSEEMVESDSAEKVEDKVEAFKQFKLFKQQFRAQDAGATEVNENKDTHGP